MTAILERLATVLRHIDGKAFWPAMIDYLFACLPFDNVIAIVFRGSAVPEVLCKRISGPDVFGHLNDLYLSAAFLLDPVYHFHLNPGAAGIYRLLDIAPDQFIRSHYYEWYYGRIGITDEVSILLPVAADTTLTISMGKDSGSGTLFGSRALDEIRQHEAVIHAILERHWALRQRDTVVKPSEIRSSQPLIAGVHQKLGISISPRQAEVALLILQGHSSASIGLRLCISPHTVKVFRRQLYARCNVSSQAELFAKLMPILSAGT
jgi:DNA-binding CsgD family transcriptional regulator